MKRPSGGRVKMVVELKREGAAGGGERGRRGGEEKGGGEWGDKGYWRVKWA